MNDERRASLTEAARRVLHRLDIGDRVGLGCALEGLRLVLADQMERNARDAARKRVGTSLRRAA